MYVLYVHNFKQYGLTPWSEFLWETQRKTSVQRNTSSFEQFNFGLLVKEWGVRLRGQWVNTTFIWRLCQIKNEKSCDELMLLHYVYFYMYIQFLSLKLQDFSCVASLTRGGTLSSLSVMIKYAVSHHCKKVLYITNSFI